MSQNRLLSAVFLFYALAILVALGSLLPHRPFSKKEKYASGSLAVVHIYGPIHTNFSASAWSKSDADDIAHRLHRLSENENVKVILLRINSPGGTVAAVQEIYREIVRCQANGKKVVASLGDVAASGGYYLASPADRIVADPGTITGSIGVIMQFGNLEGLFEKLGVRLQVIKSGAHKDIGSPARPLTPEEKHLLQASLDDAYAQFVDAVRKGRRLSPEKVRELADGRIFTGRQAQKVGLVDELGNSEDALQTAIQLANLPPHPPVISDTPPSFLSLMKTLGAQSMGGAFAALQNPGPGVQLEYLLQ